MTNAVIAINNFYETGTVTGSSESGTNVTENAYDTLLSDYWQPNSGTTHDLNVDMGSAISVDCFGFYSSDLYTFSGATAELYRSSNGSTYVLVDTITPASSGPKLLLTTSQSYRYWRIRITTSGASQPKIQHAYIGVQTEFQRGIAIGFAPMSLASENTPINSESTNGVFLGRTTKKMPIKTSMNFKNVTQAWMRSNWPTILSAIESKPFLVLPSPSVYPGEAAYVWTDGAIKTPAYSQAQLINFSIQVKARIT